MTVSPVWMAPDFTTPETTVPTKGTENVSLMWNSKGGSVIVVAVVWEDVQEGTDEVEVFTGDVADLEDRADALRDELCSGCDGLFVILDEDRDLAGAWRL